VTDAVIATADEPQRAIFGQPRGVFYLAFTEAWERFSFYGMQALLVLYLVNSLLKPGNAERVVGLEALRRGLETILGPLSTQAFASEIFGLYGGLVYFTPVFGGLLGDRVLGQRRTVMLGAVLMAAGHLLMAFDAPFLLALLLLIVGCGCLKGNISAQVGNLYEAGDVRRTRAFAIFNVGINFGGLFGPFVCGAIGEIYGWHYGFAVAGVLMLAALATYTAGLRWMPPDRRRVARAPSVAMSRHDWRIVYALLAMLLLGVFFSIAYYQLSDSYMIWISATVDRRAFGVTVPVTWFSGLDSLFTIASTPLLIRFWQWQAARGIEPGDLTKIGLASFAVGAAHVMLAFASRGHGPVNIIWPLLFSGILGTAFVYQWPTTLALVSRAAPAQINSTMMGVSFLTLFLSYNIVGWLGGFYERMSPSQFWLMNAAIGVTGGILVFIFRGPLERVLTAPTP
jgi:POT family proton-dependent oligopeptide transporter